jgi:hypothetical protein
LYRRLRRNDITLWRKKFIEALEAELRATGETILAPRFEHHHRRSRSTG